jgi:hypothetical protein
MQWTGANLQANAATFLVFGFSNTSWAGGALPFDLGVLGMPGCPLLVSPDAATLAIATAAGDVRIGLPIPGIASLIGLALHGQMAAQDPGRNAAGLAVTAGVRVVIGQ